MVVFTLTHEHVCSEEQCRCVRQAVGVTDHDPTTGAREVRAVKKRLPSSITLLAKGTPGGGDKLEGLPAGVRRIEDIAKAIVAGDLRVTDETGPAPAPAKPGPGLVALATPPAHEPPKDAKDPDPTSKSAKRAKE